MGNSQKLLIVIVIQKTLAHEFCLNFFILMRSARILGSKCESFDFNVLEKRGRFIFTDTAVTLGLRNLPLRKPGSSIYIYGRIHQQ